MTGSKYCKCFALEDPLVFMEYRYACWRRQYESASCNSFVMSTCYPAMFCQRCKILRATELKLEKSGEVGLHWEGELFCQQSRETQPDPAASQTNPISNSENLDIISKAQIKQIRTSFDAPPTTTEDYACMFAAPLLWTLCFAPCPLWPHQAVYGKHSSGLKFLDQSANQCTVKRLQQVQAKDPYTGPCSLSFIQHIFGCGMLFTLVVLRHTIAKGMQVRDTKCRQHAEQRAAQWFETWHSELHKQDIVVQRKQTLQNPSGTLLNNSAVNPRSSPHFSAFNRRIATRTSKYNTHANSFWYQLSRKVHLSYFRGYVNAMTFGRPKRVMGKFPSIWFGSIELISTVAILPCGLCKPVRSENGMKAADLFLHTLIHGLREQKTVSSFKCAAGTNAMLRRFELRCFKPAASEKIFKTFALREKIIL